MRLSIRGFAVLDRRILLALVTAGTLGISMNAAAQQKAPTKVRYVEIVRTILYAPLYVAVSKGYFKEAGLEFSTTISGGADKSLAALIGNAADISLMGPETAIYVANSESPTKIKIFCGLTTTDGLMLVSRSKTDKFDWSMLKGKEILAWRAGGTPNIFLEAAMRKNGVDPARDAKLVSNVAVPARMGAWLTGQHQFAIFPEPDASIVERQGTGQIVASIGATVGDIDYTTFMATDAYIKQNPHVIQTWTNVIYRAQKHTHAASTQELVTILKEFFPGVELQVLASAVERYKKYRIWKTSPVVEPQAIDGMQDLLIMSGVLDKAKRVRSETLLAPEFARKAKQ